MENIPVYLINGFLDSGKSEFINYTINAPYFRTDGTTLLILCEEGEVEYSPKTLKETETVIKKVEDFEDFTVENLLLFEKEVSPERIIIEWNGMWNFKDLQLPRHWVREQQITNIDASTFSLYFNNMKSLLAEMLRFSDMIIFNRCDDLDEELAVYRRNVKAINQTADIIFEDANGEVSAIFEDELPYDLESDTIALDDNSYGIWYIDMLDHHERYLNKTIEFKAMVLRPEPLPKGSFIPMRLVMTCCADDIAPLGFVCSYDGSDKLREESWVKVRATMKFKFHPAYGSEGPVLTATSVEPCEPPENEVIGI